MNKIVLITSDSLRHIYFVHKLYSVFENNLDKIFIERSIELNNVRTNQEKILKDHFLEREKSEYSFFSKSKKFIKNHKIHLLDKGSINDDRVIDSILDINPSLIVTYGCSIIKPPLIKFFEKRIINVHLGLSPYYLGAGTNFHALSNNEFQFFGFSIIYMDEGIDTGEIIHQSRGDFLLNDTPHSAGNRLIKKMVNQLIIILKNFNDLKLKKIQNEFYGSKVFKIIDADLKSVIRLNQNFKMNLLKYLKNREKIDSNYPIIEQNLPGL